MAVIYLIRHGQASWGQQDYDQLSELGIQQAGMLGQVLRQRIGRPDAVISGAMRRHRQTAEHALAAMELQTDWHEDARWNEYDHQQLLERINPRYNDPALLKLDMAREAHPRQKFQDVFDQALLRWLSGQYDAEYAESWPAFKARIGAALEHALSHEGTTLVFTSGGAIGAAVRQLWNLPDESWLHVNRVIANAAITKIVRGKRGIHLSTFNEHNHFEGDDRRWLTYR
ncbi:MAG: histidine phosphatase family protein [Pirellulaceae bacterium]|nr:histidine phosphatase family protein [Pirellulaceae bacterium]